MVSRLRFNDTIDNAGQVLDVTSSLTGKTSVKGGVVGAGLKMKSGTMIGAVTGTAKGGTILTFDASTRTINNDYTLELCNEKHKCKTCTGNAPFSLPAGVTGDWTLDTTITATGDKLSGPGALTLGTGRTFIYQILGTYNTRSEVAKLKLVGQGDAAGSSLSLTTQGTGMSKTALKGKVLGQTPTFP